MIDKKVAVVVLTTILLAVGLRKWYNTETADTLLNDVKIPPHLIEHSKDYKESRVIKVIDGIYVAIGYSLANSILIEGKDGSIVVDTTENLKCAREIRAGFRQVSSLPIKAIFYTHFHADHTMGAEAFIDDTNNPPDIWAHQNLLEQLQKMAMTGPIHFRRASRQFGMFVPSIFKKDLGLDLHYDTTGKSAPLYPTKVIHKEDMMIEIAGIKIRVFHLPGETSDHIGIHVLEKNIFLPGDNIYKAFPNLSALRGTSSRDVMVWVSALDKILKLNPAILIPSHTLPIVGKNNIQDIVSTYRDAIKFVHDQTLRYMNKGMHPDDIVPKIKLPPQLHSHPYLSQDYGEVSVSVRGIFSSYMGWFSGDPVDLEPLTTTEKADRVIRLAGGVGKTLSAAQDALDKDDYQWALELSSYVFRKNPSHGQAKHIRATALKRLAELRPGSNSMSYYVSMILEDYQLANPKLKPGKMVFQMPLENIFKIMSTRIKAEECYDLNTITVFNFTDTKEIVSTHLRNGILEVSTTYIEDYDLKVSLPSLTLRQIIAKTTRPVMAYIQGYISVDGGILKLKNFFSCVETD